MSRFGRWLADFLDTEVTYAHVLGWLIGVILSKALF